MSDRKKELKSVYLIYSAHSLLLKDALDRLTADVGESDGEALNVRRFAAGDADILDIIAACQALSFLGGRRLVVVNGFLGLNESSQKMLAEYVGDPNPQTILVLTESVAGKPEERRLKSAAVFKACVSSKSAGVHEYAIKSGLPSWVAAALSKRNKSAGRPIIDYMITWIGADLNRLKSEIDKICDAAGDGEITLALVKDLTVVANEADVFDLVNSVIAHDPELALTRLAPLLETDSGDSRVFGLLERQFQLILNAKTRGRGLSGQKLATALGISPGQAFHLEKQSRIFSLKSIKAALKLLVEADFTRKSSPIPTRLVLEMLVVDLCEV
ncbi:MAG: DNA polymerase III subunit delta [Actinomycetota bacterium]|nr:DNA polymerase III subunit delta [Actinomycetota bacterium]